MKVPAKCQQHQATGEFYNPLYLDDSVLRTRTIVQKKRLNIVYDFLIFLVLVSLHFLYVVSATSHKIF